MPYKDREPQDRNCKLIQISWIYIQQQPKDFFYEKSCCLSRNESAIRSLHENKKNGSLH